MKQANTGKLSSRVLAFLRKRPTATFTYGEVAEALDTAPKAVGQALKAIANHEKDGRRITRRVHAKQAA